MDLLLPLLVAFLVGVSDVLDWLINIPEEIFQAYRWVLRTAADGVRELFEEYGYIAVFLGTLSENTLLVGLIVPGSLVILLAGIAAHDGAMSLPVALALGVLGTAIGDTISYVLGRFGWSRFQFLRDQIDKVRGPILHRGSRYVLFYHFAGYTRVVGPATAGLMRMPFRKWMLADYGGAFLWVLAYLAGGYLMGVAGVTLDSGDEFFRYVEWGLLVLVVIWFVYMYNTAISTWQTFQPKEETSDGAPEEPEQPAERVGVD